MWLTWLIPLHSMGDIGQPQFLSISSCLGLSSASPHVVFMACSSEITSLCHEFFGLPLFLFPWGFHSKARFVMLLFAFLSVCPIHFHCLDLIVKALQFKYKICPQWLWNMERNSIFYQTTSILSEPLPQNYLGSEVARYQQQQRTMEKDQ